jgi:hypothetical protein
MKSGLALILGKGPGEGPGEGPGDGDEPGDDDGDDEDTEAGLVAATDDVFDAFKSGDKAAFRAAMRDMVEILRGSE